MASSKALILSLFVLATSAIPQATSSASSASASTLVSFGDSTSTDSPFSFGDTSSTESPFSFGAASSTTTAHPTGVVIQIPFPGGVDNNQILVGSLIGTANSLTTVAITCPEGTDSNDCGFYPPITLTAGPSTLSFSLDNDSFETVDEACQFSSGGGVCTILVSGDASVLATETDVDASTLTGSTTIASTTTYAANDIVMYPITVTAGQTAGLSSAASTTAGGSSSGAASTSRSTSGAGSGSNTGASASSTSAFNDAKALAPGAAAAGLMGIVALML